MIQEVMLVVLIYYIFNYGYTLGLQSLNLPLAIRKNCRHFIILVLQRINVLYILYKSNTVIKKDKRLIEKITA